MSPTDMEILEGPGFRERLERISADRHSPEAAGLYRVLFDYTRKRVGKLGARSRLSHGQQEEVVGEVLLSLMKGGLASFRGGSLPELLGFVRTVTDRTAWRLVRKADRERQLAQTKDAELARGWSGQAPPPVDAIELEAASPLAPKDQAYLITLLRAGTKAALARETGVSRAAVTQRVQRILQRVDDLDAGQRMAHDAWLQREARVAVALEE